MVTFIGSVGVDWLLQAAIILGMFILRLGVPLAITLAVGYWLRRLDAKWQTEAQVRWEASQAQDKVEAEPEMIKVIEQPCWVLKECPEPVRFQCPAYQHPDIPCWLARRQAEGRLPVECSHCELFSPRQIAHSPN